MSDVKEEHTVEAQDGSKRGVVSLLEAMTKAAKEMPEGKRYDVTIDITEVDD